jgi:hypothetical protein
LWADHGLKAFSRPKPLATIHSISADALHLGCILSHILAIPRKKKWLSSFAQPTWLHFIS